MVQRGVDLGQDQISVTHLDGSWVRDGTGRGTRDTQRGDTDQCDACDAGLGVHRGGTRISVMHVMRDIGVWELADCSATAGVHTCLPSTPPQGGRPTQHASAAAAGRAPQGTVKSFLVNLMLPLH